MNEIYKDIQSILAVSDIHPADCIKINNLIIELTKENKQLRDNIRQMDNSIDKLQKQLIKEKDNWTKLKEYIRKNIIYDDIGMKILDPSPLEDYIQELEQGVSNVED